MAQEVINAVSGDEEIVLGILAKGGSVAPIGRWKKPVESLVSKGLVRMLDVVNTQITDAGASSLSTAEDDLYDDFAKQIVGISRAHSDITKKIDSAARLLADAAKGSSKATGVAAGVELDKWAKALIEKAKELLA